MTDPRGERLISPAFVALAAATLAFFIAAGIGLPVTPRFAKEALLADDLGVGIAMGSFSAASLVTRPVVGWATDRYGRRPLFIGGGVVTVVALVLHLVSSSLPVFVLARALLGAGEGFLFVAALAAASDMAPETRRGEAISFFSLSLYLGIAIGPLIGEWLLAIGSWNAVWLGAALVTAVSVVLAWLTPETVPLSADGPGRARILHPAGIVPGIVILLGLWGMGGFLTFLPLYAPLTGLDGAAMPLAIYALIVVVLRIVGARLPDRFGAARLSSVALGLSAVGLATMGFVPTVAGLLIGTAIFACGVAFTMPALLALAVSLVPASERGTVVGTATLFLDVAFGVAPVALGAVANRAGYAPTFVVSAALALSAAGLLAVWGRGLAQRRPIAIAD
jgi:MFS family permease